MWLGAAHRPGLALRQRCRVPGGSTMMDGGTEGAGHCGTAAAMNQE
jgi:hypothetical protein